MKTKSKEEQKSQQEIEAKKGSKDIQVKTGTRPSELETRRPRRVSFDPFEQLDNWFSMDPRRMFPAFATMGQLPRIFRDPFFDFTDATRELRDVSRDLTKKSPFPMPLPATDIAEWTPKIDVIADKDNYVIVAELPGVGKDNVKVEIDGDTLTIKGEKVSEHVQEDLDKKVYRRETSIGGFVRSFTLPEGVDPKTVKASFDNGLLKLRIPKLEKHKQESVSIPIEGATASPGSTSGSTSGSTAASS